MYKIAFKAKVRMGANRKEYISLPKKLGSQHVTGEHAYSNSNMYSLMLMSEMKRAVGNASVIFLDSIPSAMTINARGFLAKIEIAIK